MILGSGKGQSLQIKIENCYMTIGLPINNLTFGAKTQNSKTKNVILEHCKFYKI